MSAAWSAVCHADHKFACHTDHNLCVCLLRVSVSAAWSRIIRFQGSCACSIHARAHTRTHTCSFLPPRLLLLPGLPLLSPSAPIFILLMYSAAMLPGSPEGVGSLGLQENSRSWSLIPADMFL